MSVFVKKKKKTSTSLCFKSHSNFPMFAVPNFQDFSRHQIFPSLNFSEKSSFSLSHLARKKCSFFRYPGQESNRGNHDDMNNQQSTNNINNTNDNQNQNQSHSSPSPVWSNNSNSQQAQLTNEQEWNRRRSIEKEAYQNNSQSEHQDHHSDVNSRIKTMILNKQNKDQELHQQYQQHQEQQQALQHQHEQQMQQDQQKHQDQQHERQQHEQHQQIQMHQEQMQHLMQQQQQQGIGRSSPLLSQQQIRENSRILSPISGQQSPQQIQQQIHIQQISDQQQHEQYYGMSNDFSKVNAPSNLSGMNFLVQGHHPQNLVTEGGGVWDWGTSQSYLPETGGMSAMESFMKYAASMDEKAGLHDLNKLPGMRTFLSTSSFQPSYNYKLPSSNPTSGLDPVQNLKQKNIVDYERKSLNERKSYLSDNRWTSFHDQKRRGYTSSPSNPFYHESKKSYLGSERLFSYSKNNSHTWSDKHVEPKPPYNDPLWASRDYAPYVNPSIYWANKLNPTLDHGYHLKHQPCSKIPIDDRRPQHLVPLLLKQKDFKVPFGVDPRMNELSELKKSYVFAGEGGPCELSDCTGPWCCRRGGTDTPTPEHMKDGLCQGMRTQDEMMESKELNNNEEPFTMKTEDASSKEMMDHIER